METMFYDESSLLTTTTRKSLENTALRLNLCTEKVLDIGSKKDELGFGDLADFLVSPDIGISSPDLENLVWKEWNAAIKPADITTEVQLAVKQDVEQATEVVTKEQEVFAHGFTEALKRLRETENKESEEQPEEDGVVPDSESSDSSSSDEISTSPYNNDEKITFISYSFNSKEPLPSFQETFSKNISKESKEFCLQIKMEKKEFELCVSKSDEVQMWDSNENTDSKNESCSYEWDNVETVDEGFCSREEIPNSLEEDKFIEEPNLSLTWQDSENVDLNNDDIFQDKPNGNIIDNFTRNNYHTICDIDMLDDHERIQKNWLSNQSNLHHFQTASGL